MFYCVGSCIQDGEEGALEHTRVPDKVIHSYGTSAPCAPFVLYILMTTLKAAAFSQGPYNSNFTIKVVGCFGMLFLY